MIHEFFVLRHRRQAVDKIDGEFVFVHSYEVRGQGAEIEQFATWLKANCKSTSNHWMDWPWSGFDLEDEAENAMLRLFWSHKMDFDEDDLDIRAKKKLDPHTNWFNEELANILAAEVAKEIDREFLASMGIVVPEPVPEPQTPLPLDLKIEKVQVGSKNRALKARYTLALATSLLANRDLDEGE